MVQAILVKIYVSRLYTRAQQLIDFQIRNLTGTRSIESDLELLLLEGKYVSYEGVKNTTV